ncbi:MAG: helix-turn-helix domain-containing protein [Lachnospiraceae bacterium]|nr:helix-turn-helix domain-containing protein [Lachnospiraceae bacterium]MCM1235539.1 helix-turn-helix domain-containing protein [Ruminococcus flavefaciens]
MKTFAELLKEWKDTNSYSVRSIGAALYVDQATVSRWLGGDTPAPRMINRVSALTGIDVKELLRSAGYDESRYVHLSDNPMIDRDKLHVVGSAKSISVLQKYPCKSTTAQLIRQYIIDNKLTLAQFEELCGVDYATLSRWLCDKLPSVSSIPGLATVLNISDYVGFLRPWIAKTKLTPNSDYECVCLECGRLLAGLPMYRVLELGISEKQWKNRIYGGVVTKTVTFRFIELFGCWVCTGTVSDRDSLNRGICYVRDKISKEIE